MVSKRFLPQEIIRRKRDGACLDPADIKQLVAAVTDGAVSEGQVGAFTMAVFIRGMEHSECVALTLAMRDSGTCLEWDRHVLHGPVVDKHSSGGVGDCVSLMLAPMLAACGAHVPMISGRGLGHSGGTLDKLCSIPGYCINPTLDQFRQVVETEGCAIVGQSDQLAPADGRMYAVRDVTATVESVPLITASILSKKLAAGLDALVMDVKTGNGAFAATPTMAQELADSIVKVACLAGVPTVAVLTDMDQPLAPCAGNALEVFEVVDYLVGKRRDPRLHEVVMTLGSELLVAAGLISEILMARRVLEQSLTEGAALERFQAMITALGGPATLVDQPAKHLPTAPVTRLAVAAQEGVVTNIDTRTIGLSIVELGGGRTRPNDVIDPSVGFSELIRLGDLVSPGAVLGRVHAQDDASAEQAVLRILESVTIGSEVVEYPPLIREIRREA